MGINIFPNWLLQVPILQKYWAIWKDVLIPSQSSISNLILSKNSCMHERNNNLSSSMCGHSLLNSLSKIQKQVRNSTKINIVVRRMDFVDETNLLYVLVSRILRLKKGRFELSRFANSNGIQRIILLLAPQI